MIPVVVEAVVGVIVVSGLDIVCVDVVVVMVEVVVNVEVVAVVVEDVAVVVEVVVIVVVVEVVVVEGGVEIVVDIVVLGVVDGSNVLEVVVKIAVVSVEVEVTFQTNCSKGWDSFKKLALNGMYSTTGSSFISSILTGSSFLISVVGIFGTASNATNWLFRTSSNNLGSSVVGSFLWIFLSVSYLWKTLNASFAALKADCQGANPCKFRPLSTLTCCCSALSASWPSLWMKA